MRALLIALMTTLAIILAVVVLDKHVVLIFQNAVMVVIASQKLQMERQIANLWIQSVMILCSSCHTLLRWPILKLFWNLSTLSLNITEKTTSVSRLSLTVLEIMTINAVHTRHAQLKRQAVGDLSAFQIQIKQLRTVASWYLTSVVMIVKTTTKTAVKDTFAKNKHRYQQVPTACQVDIRKQNKNNFLITLKALKLIA